MYIYYILYIICILNQYKSLRNLHRRIYFGYGHLTKISTEMEAEEESHVSDEGEANLLLEMSNLFEHFMFFLEQTMNLCSYIGHFNVLMSFLVENKEQSPC